MNKEPSNLVEIARSFSYKLNVGNYESRDFFCSQKAECKPEDAEKVSESLADFCKEEVVRAVNKYKQSTTPQGKGVGERKEDSKTSAELDSGINDI